MLEKKVGAGRFLLVVTSTGYTDDEITDFSKYRIPTGTFSVTRASALLNMYLMAVYGQGQYVETEFGSQLFLNQKLIEDKQLNLSDVLTRFVCGRNRNTPFAEQFQPDAFGRHLH